MSTIVNSVHSCPASLSASEFNSVQPIIFDYFSPNLQLITFHNRSLFRSVLATRQLEKGKGQSDSLTCRLFSPKSSIWDRILSPTCYLCRKNLSRIGVQSGERFPHLQYRPVREPPGSRPRDIPSPVMLLGSAQHACSVAFGNNKQSADIPDWLSADF